MTVAAFPLGDLQAVLDHLARADPGQALVPCGITRLLLGRDQVRRVADEVTALLREVARPTADRPRVTLLVDATLIRRQGADVKADVGALLSERFVLHTEVLTDKHPVLHADENSLETACRVAQGADAVVTVGGGTITDIGKIAAQAAGSVPLVTVQTAASVDGFTDNVSVILRSGVKRTVDSCWPDVVIADVELISEAPAAMNRAGFGEITSMFTAPADWKLADLLGMDASFHDAPTQLLDAVGGDIDSWSSGIASAEVDAVERLAWALAVRGIATGVSGTTACLSGVEHLISHMLDLHHGERGLPMGLHGAQVGVGAVVAAVAWEMLFDRMANGAPPVRVPDPDRAHADVVAAFAPLDPNLGIAEECWRDYSQKIARCSEQRERFDRVLSSWSEYAPALHRLVRPSADIARHLRAAGAATRFADLDPAVDPEVARWAVANSGLMRNRFTVVDLLTLLGGWGHEDVNEVMHRAELAVGKAAPPAVAPR